MKKPTTLVGFLSAIIGAYMLTYYGGHNLITTGVSAGFVFLGFMIISVQER